MARRVAEHLVAEKRDIVTVIASPLQRAQETATPSAKAFNLELGTDERLIEAANYFEGKTFGVGDGSLRHPEHWPHLINPFRPSWGEPYKEQVARVHAAVDSARELARGHEALLVSHQLPIWIARSAYEGKRLWHDPRKRECNLASLTSLTFDGDTLVEVKYTEPVADLYPNASKVAGA
jgi:broad specificity phosphatase PhoE